MVGERETQACRMGERRKRAAPVTPDPLYKAAGERSKPVFILWAEAFEDETHNRKEACSQI